MLNRMSFSPECDPLTAEQVYQIADPIITLNILANESTPLVKVYLKARLAIENFGKHGGTTRVSKETIKKFIERSDNSPG